MLQLGSWSRVEKVVAEVIEFLVCRDCMQTFENELKGIQSCLLALRQKNMEMKSAITGLSISMEQNFRIVMEMYNH